MPALVVAIICLTATSVAAGETLPARKSIVAIRTEHPPTLDGRLDDPVWQQAPFVDDLHVVVSNEFGEPGERSRVYVAYDDDNLYFAARFWDSDPDGIVAKVLNKRDVSFGEDGFSITLDPYDQGRAGYMFDVNPNGMRSEAIYTDADRQNWDWEGIWDGAATRDGEGWSAEAVIPLKTLSFDPALDAWGVNFTRWHGRDNEQFGWVSYNRKQNLSRTGLLNGLAGLQQGHGLDVIPGLRTGISRDYVSDEEETFLEPSLDAFWKITPSLTAALTLNPDFSGTTADARQINLTRFDLFFPEQRAFFLQDSDIFEFGRIEEENGMPFFSRRIGLDDEGRALALDAGTKLAGRAGPLSIGVLGVHQDSATGPESVDLFVGRIATNVLAESSVGLIVTIGNPDADADNSLVGADFRYLNTRLGDGRVLEASAWFQKTDTEGLEGDDSAYGVNIAMPNSEGWSGELGFKTIEENYFPALGFASRTDFTASRVELGYTWRPEDSWIRAIEAGVDGEFVNSINGRDQSNEIELTLVEIENQGADSLILTHHLVEERLTESFEISDGIVIPAGTYKFDQSCVAVITGQQRAMATESSVCDGDFYDGRIIVFETRTIWRPNPHLKIVLGGEYNGVDLPQGDFITRLVRLNLDIAFNTAWSWENFVQYDNDSETIGVNSILRWIPRAGRETVLAVNSQLEDFDRDQDFRSYTSDLTLKLSHTFRF
jgi:uncharacterized protein DUF5916/cellulose/xylan binding protein with CBM9 domain